MMTCMELYQKSRQVLADYTPDTCDFEASQLLEAVTGYPAAMLPLRGWEAVSTEKCKRMESLLQQRLNGEPLQYLLGSWEFFGYPLRVGPGVLIPRGDTETVVETAIALLKDTTGAVVADLCSGSGAIAIALLHQLVSPEIYAVELSEAALVYLRENANHHREKSTGVLHVLPGDVLKDDGLKVLPAKPFDLIVSNPPYIPRHEMETLSPEVRREPEMALVAGEDGLDFYRVLSKSCCSRLRSGGYLVFEVGYNQAEPVLELLKENGYEQPAMVQDLAGINRCVFARRP